MRSIYLVIGMIAIVVLSVVLVTSVKADGHLERDKCLQYEQDGVLPSGSCSCAGQLFSSWSESYDWSDACSILKAKNL